MKFDDSADSSYLPPPARPVGCIRRMFDGKTTVDPVDSIPKDTTMMMGDGKTTESDGLGDSKHASLSGVAGLVGSLSTDYGSMPPLSSTLAETGSISRASTVGPVECVGPGGSDMDMAKDGVVFDDFSGVASADIPMAVGGDRNSEGTGLGDSQHTLLEDSPNPLKGCLLIDQCGEYSQLSKVGLDIRQLCLVVVTMGNVIRRLERKVNDLEDSVDDRRRAAVSTISVPVVPVPAVPVHAVPAPRRAQHVGGKGKGVNHVLLVPPLTVPTVRIVRPTAILAPAPVNPAVKPAWSTVARATSGVSEFTLVKRSGRNSSPLPASGISEWDRHIIVRFEKRGHKIRLPAGVNTETVKNALNKVQSAGGEARFGS